MLETILLREADMAASSIAINLPWDRMFNELRDLEEARRPSRAPHEALAPERRSELAQRANLGGLKAILNEAAAAISDAEKRAEMLEQQVAAVVQTTNAQVQAAEAASKALERDVDEGNERIRALELRAKTA